MIEVLVHEDLPLSDETTVVSYSQSDRQLVNHVLSAIDSRWTSAIAVPPSAYPRSRQHADAVQDYLARALADAGWRGNGLEFDRL